MTEKERERAQMLEALHDITHRVLAEYRTAYWEMAAFVKTLDGLGWVTPEMKALADKAFEAMRGDELDRLWDAIKEAYDDAE